MRNRVIQIVTGAMAGLLVLIGSTLLVVSGQEAKMEQPDGSFESRARNGRGRIVGTWQTVVTPRNCQTAAPLAPPFPGLITFNKGGTLSGTSPVAPAGFGNWDGKGGQEYDFAFIVLRYGPTGSFIGTQKVRQRATIGAGGDDLTSTGSVEFLDTNGVVIGTQCATATGVRFE